MNTKTRIFVLHSKDIYISIAITIALIFLILALIISIGRLHPSQKPAKESSLYTPGVYTSSITLGGNPVDIEVCVDSDNICSISTVNLNDYISTMYPLLDNILKDLESQICQSGSTKNVTISQSSQYTSNLLLKAINEALEKATNN